MSNLIYPVVINSEEIDFRVTSELEKGPKDPRRIYVLKEGYHG